TTGQVKRGETDAARATVNLRALKAEQMRAEIARLENLKQKVEARLAANAQLAAMSGQIKLDITPDGLRIQIIDEDKRPMFSSGSAEVLGTMRVLLREVGSVLAEVPNRLTLEGHTDALPFGGGERGYSNWELSADRANASRRELVSGGLPEEHVLRVQGLAASTPYDRKDPASPANRRISIIVMNREAEERVFRSAQDTSEPTTEEITGGPAEPVAVPLGQIVAPPAARSSPAPAHR
ncbi:MAG: OmpA family protein, partial [Chitinophagaceae bacterium]|nr:OmpA family protein [Rubrivivax sp.]